MEYLVGALLYSLTSPLFWIELALCIAMSFFVSIGVLVGILGGSLIVTYINRRNFGFYVFAMADVALIVVIAVEAVI